MLITARSAPRWPTESGKSGPIVDTRAAIRITARSCLVGLVGLVGPSAFWSGQPVGGDPLGELLE
jgi:hypothetical protein